MRRLALAALVAVAGCRAAPVPGHEIDAPGTQLGVDVAQITLALTLDPANLAVAGRAELVVRHPDTLGVLVLGLDRALSVGEVRVAGQAVAAERRGDALRVPLPASARQGARGRDSTRVEVAYAGVPAAGLYAGEAAGQRVVYTDGWPDRTAGWLPTVHHPSDPARLDLTLVVPDSLDVVASGVRVSETVAAGRRTARFRLDRPAPAYTLAFAVGRFDVRAWPGASVPVRSAVLRGEPSGGLGRMPAALDTLARLLGPYPYAAYATVQVPKRFAGMENAAAAFLRADLYRAAVDGRNVLEEVALHELVHQWWGNAVVPADWRDLWLAEGPATYLTIEALRRLDGADAARRHLALMVAELEPAAARRRLVPAAYADPGAVLTPTVYQKGAAVLHVLRLTVGERAFWQAFRALTDAHRDGPPLSTAAFQTAVEGASGRDLDGLFAFWVHGEGTPTLRTRWDGQTLSWTISGDGGTLAGVPVELLVRQPGQPDRVARTTDGALRLAGSEHPEVLPVGVPLRVR